MSGFIIKLIAIFTMLVDHLGYVIPGSSSWFNYIGRLSFPLFAFLLTEGYLHTKSKKNYFIRLASFAVISQLPFSLFHGIINDTFVLNIFFTLLLGFIAIWGYEHLTNKWIGVLFAVCFANVGILLHVDYSFWGVLIIFLFWIFKKKPLYLALSFIGITALKYFPSYLQTFSFPILLLFLGTCASLLIIFSYNGKKGINTKYLLYGIYPIHLFFLYIIHILNNF